MRKTASAIMQDKGAWHGLSVTVGDGEVTDLKAFSGHGLDELKKMLGDQPCGVALEDAGGYLSQLAFPFGGRRKIGLVIGGQLEELLPLPVEDMVIDFQELGADGGVLAAAVPKSALAELNGQRKIRNVSLQSLAALYALKWFKLLPQEPCVLLHCTGDAAVVMTLVRRRIVRLRHFFRSPHAAAVIDALREVAAETASTHVRYLMVGGDDAPAEKVMIESALNINVELLDLYDYVNGEHLPAQGWAGLGAAIMALNSKGEINLSGERHHTVSGVNRAALYVTGGLAAISLLALSLSSLDFYLKQRAYDYLSREPNRIYRAVFPKAPPVKDVARSFEQRIGNLDGPRGTSTENGAASPLSLLDEISSKIDPQVDVKLSEFVADDKEFAIAGTTTSFASLDKIKAALQQVKGMDRVELQSVDMASGGQVRFRFRGKP